VAAGALLDEDTVVDYLAERGLPVTDAPVERLAGGISNIVLGVGDVVVKQSLPRLQVEDDWPAPIGRVVTEAAALRLVGDVTPGYVPAVYDADEQRCVIVVERANGDWRNWKELLIAGHVDGAAARRLGEVLGRWHNATVASDRLPERFHETEPFEQLRVDPYYRTVARRAPDVAAPVHEVIDRMLATRTCLVHGDFSPKNVMVGPDGRLWVIDFEVAHVGDPTFDVAFLLSHLILKSMHCPDHIDAYDQAAAAFTTAYWDVADVRVGATWNHVWQHVGCLLLARVRGKSPAPYLTEPQREQAWTLGESLVRTTVDGPLRLPTLRDEVRQ
jgi:5-methylthioribose kinase